MTVKQTNTVINALEIIGKFPHIVMSRCADCDEDTDGFYTLQLVDIREIQASIMQTAISLNNRNELPESAGLFDYDDEDGYAPYTFVLTFLDNDRYDLSEYIPFGFSKEASDLQSLITEGFKAFGSLDCD